MRTDLKPYLYDVNTGLKPTGLLKVCGNKGGVMLSFRLLNFDMCFINCHLASGPSNNGDRIQTALEILRAIKIPNNRLDLPNQYDYFFWMGDFNWRVSLDFQKVVELIDMNDLGEIKKFDQLGFAREQGFFKQLREGDINFKPTYRRNRTR
jgi:hypothetical protein